MSEPSYTAAAVKALGPAFNFWQEIGDSIWFICEGPQSRTDLEGLEQYLRDRRALNRLDALGCPVEGEMFNELRAAESKLGPPQETWREEHQIGASMLRLGGGTRRDGFEILRDIVARYRGEWTKHHLDAYLQARWKDELVAVSDAYHRFMADRTKPPTLRQFVKMAAPACANWFAGDVTAVYSAVGLKAPISTPTYTRLLPDDCRGFTMRVFLNLGGTPVKHERFAISEEQGREHQEEHRRNSVFAGLADESLEWVELAEGLGRPPELTEFGARNFEHYTELIGADTDTAWRTYANAVQLALVNAGISSEDASPGADLTAESDDAAASIQRSQDAEAASPSVGSGIAPPAAEDTSARRGNGLSVPSPRRQSLFDRIRRR